MKRDSDRDTFYRLLASLDERSGGRRMLGDCHGRMVWPRHGVYFLFDEREYRDKAPDVARVIRVGTHALTTTSRALLWGRLSQHRGNLNPRGGNHRGSIFRLLVGQALMNRYPDYWLDSWGKGQSASQETRFPERALEERVSDYLGRMSVLVLPVPEASARGFIERNSIALLSGFLEPTPDVPTLDWLGHDSGRDRVRRSGLWNNNHVNEVYEPGFLHQLEDLVMETVRA